MLNTKSAINSFLVTFYETLFVLTKGSGPCVYVYRGEEKLKEVFDTGTKMSSGQVAEDNAGAHQPAKCG